MKNVASRISSLTPVNTCVVAWFVSCSGRWQHDILSTGGVVKDFRNIGVLNSNQCTFFFLKTLIFTYQTYPFFHFQ